MKLTVLATGSSGNASIVTGENETIALDFGLSFKKWHTLLEKYDLKELKDMIGFGGSPRASINLALAARSYAFIKRRGYVIPEDVRAVAHDVLRHRIGLTYEAEASNMTSDEIVSKILNKVEVP